METTEEALSEIDPRAVRATLLEELRQIADADCAFFFTIAELDGRPVVGDWQARGGRAADLMRTLERDPALLPAPLIERLRRPQPLQTHSFMEGVTTPWTELMRETRLYDEVLRPMGFSDMARVLVYGEERMAGWVGVMNFRSGVGFRRNTRRRLGTQLERVRKIVLDSDAEVRRRLPKGADASLILRRDGEVEYASVAGNDWLTGADFVDALRDRIQAYDENPDSEAMMAVRMGEIRLTRLDGAGAQVRYLARITPATPFRQSCDTLLSPVQRQVAQYAASGATVQEIADALQRAPETIRTHLRAAYSRLGVSTRLELARLLERGESDDRILN